MIFKVDDKLKNAYWGYINKEYSYSSANVNQFMLRRIDDVEHMIGAKVYNFNRDNLLMLLGSCDTTSVTNLIVYKSIISQYLTFVSDMTSSTAISYLNNITTKDLDSVVNRIARDKKYMTKREYITFLNSAYNKLNKQDLAIFVLLWNGIKGFEYSDLASFEVSNYDIEGYLTVNKRRIKLEEIEAEILFEAITESEYIIYSKREPMIRAVKNKETGEMTYKEVKRRPPVERYTLNQNCKYIIKQTNTIEGEVESAYNLKMRITKSLKFLGNKHLNGVSVYTSGIIYKILEENNFEDVGYADMCRWLESRNIKLSTAKISEVSRVIRNKLIKEGTIQE